MKNQSSKLWEARSKDCEDVFWIRAKTIPLAKKILREYLKSSAYWEREDIGKDLLALSTKLFKSFQYKELPGIFVDDTRGDLITNLTEPGDDYIRITEEGH